MPGAARRESRQLQPSTAASAADTCSPAIGAPVTTVYLSVAGLAAPVGSTSVTTMSAATCGAICATSVAASASTTMIAAPVSSTAVYIHP